MLDHHHAVMLETLEKQFEAMEAGQPGTAAEEEKIISLIGQSGIPLDKWKEVIAGITRPQDSERVFAA